MLGVPWLVDTSFLYLSSVSRGVLLSVHLCVFTTLSLKTLITEFRADPNTGLTTSAETLFPNNVTFGVSKST